MEKVTEILDGVKTIAIGGHIRPDGDCIGSCMGLYLYLKKNFPEIETDIFLEKPRDVFYYISSIDEIKTDISGYEDRIYDLFITVDVSAKDRLAVAGDLFEKAAKTICIDHHISNHGFAAVNVIDGNISSASELLYTLLDPELIDISIAEAIYTGIISDTGVFQYTSTSPQTMQIAGELIKQGFDFNRIIEESYYQKTYIQTQVMGRVLAESIMLLDGKYIIGYLKRKDMNFYHITGNDLEGVVSQLRLVKGVEVAILMYEQSTLNFKVSLRSNGKIDVSKVAAYFGGGGHVKAAGCEMSGSLHDVINNLTAQIEKQMLEA